MQLNCNGGLGLKLPEIGWLLRKYDVHVCLMQETLARGRRPKLKGFTIHHCSCVRCHGMAIAVRNDVPAIYQGGSCTTGVHTQTVKVWWAGKTYTLVNVYRPPKNRFDLVLSEERRTIYAGDLNANHQDRGYCQANPAGRELKETLDSSSFVIQQSEGSPYTFMSRASGGLSRPDITIVSADLDPITTTDVVEDVGSDHLPILTRIACSRAQQEKNRLRWNYRKTDAEKFRRESDKALSRVNFEGDIDTIYDQIRDAVYGAAKRAIPRDTPRGGATIWTSELTEAVAARRAAGKKARLGGDDARTDYNRLTARVRCLMRETKRDRWHHTCDRLSEKGGTARAWKLLKALEGHAGAPLPLGDESAVTGAKHPDLKLAEKLNKYFAGVSKGKKRAEDKAVHLERRKEEKKKPDQQGQNGNLLDSFSTDELEEAIGKCKKGKAPGPDGITNEMISGLSDYGKMIVLRFINMTWERGSLPKEWKNALIVPLIKSGKKAGEPSSYRPISLTSCFGKVAERMVNRRLVWHLESRGLLSCYQSGFRRGKTTIDQLVRLTQGILDGFQRKEHTLAVFLDFQKAYDRVWRGGLLLKMLQAGVRGSLYSWVQDFLRERTISTRVNSACSRKRTLEEGLPQGSAISCTLFLIFINDLTGELHANKGLFADDLAVWETGPNQASLVGSIQPALKSIGDYCDKWKLSLNTGKSVYSVFTMGHRVKDEDIRLDIQGMRLAREEHPRYLGVTLDRQLCFEGHVKTVAVNAQKRMRLLKSLRGTSWGANCATMRNLYTGYVRSVIDYSLPVLSTASDRTMRSLEVVQNSALRIMCGALSSTPIGALEIMARVEPIQLRRTRKIMVEAERILRLEPGHPTREMMENWTAVSRLQKTSFMHEVKREWREKPMPEQREEILIQESRAPGSMLKKPRVEVELVHKGYGKSHSEIVLRSLANETIETYPDRGYRAYTDGSVCRDVGRTGYGIVVKHPYDGHKLEICGPGASSNSIFDLEAKAIEKALLRIEQLAHTKGEPLPIVLFSDSQSVLTVLRRGSSIRETTAIRGIRETSDRLIRQGHEVSLQWVPSHVGVTGNESADTLAKQGLNLAPDEGPISYEGAKALVEEATKRKWKEKWKTDVKGRRVYEHLLEPKKSDAWVRLKRSAQSVITHLRTGHAGLKGHLFRIGAAKDPNCRLCNASVESVDHVLFECPKLAEDRCRALGVNPTISSCLYGGSREMLNTVSFYNRALRRGNAPVL